ncbi:hypothetical protein LBMAG57_05350 [Verrucomicrobiota bacterium]|nr:hypothetical protein LBMAG57_05350 [Verrucomicrobiota bacterium]
MSPTQAHNHKIAAEGLGRITRLIAQPDFIWFLREAAGKELTRLDNLIHDRKESKEDREAALSEWLAVKRLAEWPETFANDCGKTLGHEHRITLDITEPKPDAARATETTT